ncbi:hypothetical protein HDU87_006782 [Geranomyces variabilis]|uniref:Aromatic amino acid beta-eliminating lyase/threonine aldolase domain-containing protein n=1 Tax=Geranomyces variabilis TaxID=109894 RepID=A0AAD5TPW6_9FUNG|nr:hypothetical protein HDU87_006782 [Geranomyces variabilis]
MGADSSPQMAPLLLRPADRTVVERLNATAAYAKDPKAYLHAELGDELFAERESLFSLPDTQSSPIGADFYGTGGHKEGLEKRIANDTLGKEHGLFFFTGVQAQLVACKMYATVKKRNIVAWHHQSHLEAHEEESFTHLWRFERLLLGKSPTTMPTVADVQTLVSLPIDQRPAVIVLELPNRELGCPTYSFPDLVTISKLCKDTDVALHCDGARLWEIEPFYKKSHNASYKEITLLFDSVYVSFYKGLGGVVGAMLVSNDEAFIAGAKIWQRRSGGNAYTTFQETVDCERGFNLNIGTFAAKYDKMVSIAAGIEAGIAHLPTVGGRPLVFFEPRVPTCGQAQTFFCGVDEEQFIAARDAVQAKLNVRLFNKPRPVTSPADGRRFMIEWALVNETMQTETLRIVHAFVMLAEELAKYQR